MRALMCVLRNACSDRAVNLPFISLVTIPGALEPKAPARAAATAAPHRGAAHVVCTLPRCLCHHHHRPQTPRPLQGAEEGTRQTLATRPPGTKDLHCTTPATVRAARRAKATPHPAALTASPLRAHAAQRVTPRHARPPPAPASCGPRPRRNRAARGGRKASPRNARGNGPSPRTASPCSVRRAARTAHRD